MIKYLLSYIKANRNYLCGLFGILIVFGYVLSFYINSATQLNDGWLEIYSDSLANKGLLYRDYNFPLLPFPVFLLAFLNKIFGNTLIISHLAGAILKLSILGVLYTILSRFFGYRNAFCGTIVSGTVLISIIFDCCLFSYNDLMYVLGLLSTYILLTAIKALEHKKSIYTQSLLLGLCLGLMLISKQTHGIILTISALILQIIIALRYENIKKTIIYTCFSILPIASFILILAAYLYKTNTINDFYFNVIYGLSSKGDTTSLIFHHFKVIAEPSIIWVIYLSMCFFIAFFTITKNFNPHFDTHKNKYDNLPILSLCIILSFTIPTLSLFCVKYFGLNIFDIKVFFQIDKFFKQICAIGFVFTDIFIFYLFFDYIFNRKYTNTNFYFFIFLGMVFALNYSIMLSGSMTNLTFISIGTIIAYCLQHETPLYKLKNGLIYLFVLICLFLGVTSKVICPAFWHNWESGSLIENRKEVPNVPFLKGMKLPEKEADFFSEIRTISDKYTNEDDRIYCFLNNQLFYRILERKPLTKNVNLYFDLCSDEKALSDMEILFKNPPKLIIWLKLPEEVIILHENLFRKGMLSGQRHINYAISNMIENNKYKIVKVYKNKYSDFYNNYENLITDKYYINKIEQITKMIREKEYLSKQETNINYNKIYAYDKEIENLQLEKNKILNQAKKELNINHYRYFLPNNYELYVLVKNDTYKKYSL